MIVRKVYYCEVIYNYQKKKLKIIKNSQRSLKIFESLLYRYMRYKN